jgi:pyridoxal phosphate enzyme (YggS family)
MPESRLAERLQRLRLLIAGACLRSGRSAESVTIVAVTKGVPATVVREAIAAGLTDIGENRVQEAEQKRAALADLEGLRWHMIGHLQSNKVKTALNLFDIIHSVDSIHLAEAISRRALEPVPVFLEVNVSGESTKHGVTLDELSAVHAAIAALPNVYVRGLMTVAPLSADPQAARPVFRRLRQEATALALPDLSMGMSDDFEVAVEEGATHVRIGRAIFGERA